MVIILRSIFTKIVFTKENRHETNDCNFGFGRIVLGCVG